MKNKILLTIVFILSSINISAQVTGLAWLEYIFGSRTQPN